MFIRAHKGASAVGATGVVVVLAHAILGAAAVLTAAQSRSGITIGLILVAAAALHVVTTHLRGNRLKNNRPEQES